MTRRPKTGTGKIDRPAVLRIQTGATMVVVARESGRSSNRRR
jgi:hypothetical protein